MINIPFKGPFTYDDLSQNIYDSLGNKCLNVHSFPYIYGEDGTVLKIENSEILYKAFGNLVCMTLNETIGSISKSIHNSIK